MWSLHATKGEWGYEVEDGHMYDDGDIVIMRLVSVHPKCGSGLTAEVQVQSQGSSYVFLSEQIAMFRVLSFSVIPSVIHI